MFKKIISLILILSIAIELLFTSPSFATSIDGMNANIMTDLSLYQNNKFIISFDDDSSLSNQKNILSKLNSYHCTLTDNVDSTYFLTYKNKASLKKAISYLKTKSIVAIVQPDFTYKNQSTSISKAEETIAEPTTEAPTTEAPIPTAPPITNDASIGQCWFLQNTGMNLENIPCKASYDLNLLPLLTGAQNLNPIVVAIIDTGVQVDHPDLASHIWINPGEIPNNGVDDDKNGYVDDINGWDFFHNDSTLYSTSPANTANHFDDDDHGTHVAGIIAAANNNNIGIAGVASNYNVQIMSLKVLGGQDSGSTSTAVKAIKYAEKMGASIANCSWNFIIQSKDPLLERTIHESDIMFVCAAGNEAVNVDRSPSYPASYNFSNVISVAATDSMGSLAPYSNYGKTVTTAAPGSDIYSTIIGGYVYNSGTSMATPMVTGILAMMYANKANLYPTQYKSLIKSSVLANNPLSGVVYSNGSIDASTAISKTQVTKKKKDKKKPVIKAKVKTKKNMVTVQLKIKDKGSSKIQKVRYAIGFKKKSYFKKGKKGKKILSNDLLYTTKDLNVTFYAIDRAGNDIIKHYKLRIKKS